MAINNIGRPCKFNSVDELQDKINKYFADCKLNNRPYTITGLCLSLDTTRELLCNYEDKPEFYDAIKKAKEIVANYAEEQCLTSKTPAGAIFIAKNHGFVDKQELKLDGNITQTIKPIITD